jgi:large subunit ribosomal protein L22
MNASVRSVRIAPKKANLIAKVVRGMTVPDAMEALRRMHKKGARIIETLLRSAIANASHNYKQDPQTMVIRTIVVNQGQAYRRGVPMARGRMRPIRKFLSHIDLELGFPEVEDSDENSKSKTIKKSKTNTTNMTKKTEKNASQEEKKGVKKTGSAKDSMDTSKKHSSRST